MEITRTMSSLFYSHQNLQTFFVYYYERGALLMYLLLCRMVTAMPLVFSILKFFLFYPRLCRSFLSFFRWHSLPSTVFYVYQVYHTDTRTQRSQQSSILLRLILVCHQHYSSRSIFQPAFTFSCKSK